MWVLKIIGFVLITIGAILTYGAKVFVKKYRLDINTKCDFEEELSEIELFEYKTNKAIVNLKIFGMIILFLGVVFIYYVFK